MAILYYKKINETYIQIASDEDYVLKELSEYFSFMAEGARFSPKYRAKIWDGRIRLVNLRTMTTLAGLVPSIAKFCAERGYQLVDQTEEYKKFIPDNLDNLEAWIQSLKLPFEPRDYQLTTVRYALQCGRGLLLSPTGSGKSLSIYLLARWMIEHNRRCVVIVPSTSLVEQMHNDFKNYASNDDSFDVDEQVHKLYAKIKTTKPYEDQCIITTWQSIKNYDKTLFETWDCVIVDECFDGNMRVLTPSGYVAIKDMKIGDKVINFDETTHEFKEDEVVDVYCNMPNSWSEKMYELNFDNGSCIKVTGNHKFLTKNRGWVRADELTVDDDIETSDNVKYENI